MSLKHFTGLEVIGKGSFGEVYKGLRRADGRTYAIKRISFAGMEAREQANALNEVRILASIRSRYIVRYCEAFMEGGQLYLVIDYARGGDLYTRIRKHYQQNHISVPEGEVWRAAVHLLRALALLHSNGICHRDIKSQNVFLGEGGIYILGDFNVAKITKDSLMQTQTGTPFYASPEVWNKDHYTTKSDIWSLGCFLYEVCAYRPPFWGSGVDDLRQNILKGQYPRIPSHYSH